MRELGFHVKSSRYNLNNNTHTATTDLRLHTIFLIVLRLIESSRILVFNDYGKGLIK